ncbi:MAG TPA: ATP-dependent zinc metalloprotease FtsH [Polyangiaceae bacterium]|nr:ATP-dependent zinc metalloprotease FtsH [Polyangiaceae bacterium]
MPTAEPQEPSPVKLPPPPPYVRFLGGFMLFLVAMLVATWALKDNSATETLVPYSVFYEWAKLGKVSAVVMDGEGLDGRLKNPETVQGKDVQTFRSNLASSDTSLLPLLHEKAVTIEVKPQEQSVGAQIALTVLPWALIIGVAVWMSRRAKGVLGAGGPFAAFVGNKGRKFDKATSVRTTFDDVAGSKAAKNDLMEIVSFLKEPERFQRLGGRVPRGVLLVGPPGTGKTLLARAIAGESGVPFYSISASEFIEMFVGLGAARVRELFSEAKKNAPAIVFIDEIDAVGRARGAGLGAGHDEREQTLNQLLSEMDGFERNDLVVVVAATNRPDVLDPALLRPGRFDRRILVDRPELAARKAILGVHSKGMPLSSDVNLQHVAESTVGFSGADLANLVNEAALSATRQSREEILGEDFSTAFDKIVLGDPRETKLDSKEKKRVAIHESGHALVAQHSAETDPPNRVSIIPRGMALGATQQSPGVDRHIMTQGELEARLRVLMAGHAAERLVLGGISTGAENDLKEATRLATHMVAHYGMSQRLGPVYYDHDAEHAFLGQRIATESGTSSTTISVIEDEARQILSRSLEEATAVIAERRAQFDTLVSSLLDRESLERDDLAGIFET